MTNASTFRQRMLAGDKLVGTFLKTPTSHATEILGDIGYDFVVIDQEHGPFDRTTSDIALLAARGARHSGAGARARPGGHSARCSIAAPPACWCPHVKTAAYAREIAAMFRYRNGSRGFATSTRAGDYTGVPMWKHIADAGRADGVRRADRGSGRARRDRRDRRRRGRRTRCSSVAAISPRRSAMKTRIRRPCCARSNGSRKPARKANKPISVYVGNASRSRLAAFARRHRVRAHIRTRASCARRQHPTCATFATR